jgi:hypothetical protein
VAVRREFDTLLEAGNPDNYFADVEQAALAWHLARSLNSGFRLKAGGAWPVGAEATDTRSVASASVAEIVTSPGR